MEGFELLANDSRDFKMYTVYNHEKDIYELNEMAFNADKYLIIELRNQFTKGFDIRSNIELSEEVSKVELEKDVKYSDLVNYFKNNKKENDDVFYWGIYSTRTEWIEIIEKCWKLYGKLWVDIYVAKEMIRNYVDEVGKIGVQIKNMFYTGRKYTRAEVKEKLNLLFVRENIKRKAKHTDLYEYFEIKESASNGVRIIEILKCK
jgi:hypothetical protein